MTDSGSSPDHESLDLADAGLALLGFAAGIMDALAFFHLGEVFPSAMTGNTALLGLALGQGNLVAASRPLVAFAGFLIGAGAASASLDLWLHKRSAPRAAFALLAFEAGLLAAFALYWSLFGPGVLGGRYGLIAGGAAAMGIQSATARLFGRAGITTIVFTSTLTAIVASTTAALFRSPHVLPFAAKRQIGMFAIYGCGAAATGFFASRDSAIVFLPVAAVTAAAALLWRAGKAK